MDLLAGPPADAEGRAVTSHEGRPRRRELGQVAPAERTRLRSTFGAALGLERSTVSMTQQALAAGAAMNLRTVRRLESGERRPTSSACWRLARALRPRGTLRDRVAVELRLRAAAGELLVMSETRSHLRRERVRAELIAEGRAAGGPVVGDHGERLGPLVVAELERMFGDGQPN